MPDIQQIYYPYWDWEDWSDGLYGVPKDLNSELCAARDLLSDPVRLEPAMHAAVVAYPRAAVHQLSNTTQNRRSWLGQAACRLDVGATSVATRAAWAQLTDEQRFAANACAERVIAEWDRDNTTTPTLF